jgi:phosphoglycerate dehydrogenase-like enzyme
VSWKILVTSPAMLAAGEAALQRLRTAGCDPVLHHQAGPLNAKTLLSVLPGCDAVLASVEAYSAEILSSPAAARLKIISRWGVGYDAIDLAAATAHGIIVTNTPGLLDEAVADYTFALLLALARRIPEGNLAVHEGRWNAHWGWDVAGKTIGLIGCGRIARAVARRAAGFKMQLLAYDLSPNADAVALGVQFVPLEVLLAQSDFVSLHAALTPESRGLLGEAQLRRMKPTALLINAGRGALLDEPALMRALRENWIAGAALDVFCEEPLPANHPFRTTPNLLLTPHQASCARDTGEQVSETAAAAILDAMQGRRPRFVVNPKVFQSPNCRLALHD